jgi:hypothetical protein
MPDGAASDGTAAADATERFRQAMAATGDREEGITPLRESLGPPAGVGHRNIGGIAGNPSLTGAREGLLDAR